MREEVGLSPGKAVGDPQHLSGPLRGKLDRAIKKAQSWILERQDPQEGFWVAELQADTTLTSDYVILKSFLEALEPRRREKAVRHLEMTQLPDGGWNIYHGGPSEINATVKAYFALKLGGVAQGAPILERAREAVLRMGGLERANIFTKMYLALHGQFEWEDIPSMPVEMMFLPTWFYLNIYEFSYWTRTIIVPLFITAALKPMKQILPPGSLKELSIGPASKRRWFNSQESSEGFIRTLILNADGALKFAEGIQLSGLRQRAIERAKDWMIEHHRMTGGLGAIFPAMGNAIVAMKALGYDPNRDLTLAKAIRDFDALVIEEEDHLRVQPCHSPVWDTVLTCYALLEAELPGGHPSLVRAGEWLLEKQTRHLGDWQVKNAGVEPGGWFFQFENEFHPDNDDTAVALLALRQMKLPGQEAQKEAIQRGLNWVLSMQGSDGGWGSFERDNSKTILNNIPYADHGAVLDPSTSDLTGRLLEMMGRLGFGMDHPRVQRAIRFLKKEQEKEGCWYGRWGVNYIYGTHLVLQGLAAVGEDLSAPYVQRAVRWFLDHQLEDGGWGETCGTYWDPSTAGQGPSTASQTAWAILGLCAVGLADSPTVRRGVEFLMERQTDEGTWQEENFTGTGFPKVFYLRYHFYRHYFPLAALGRWRRLVAKAP